ncbi:MAG: AsmA family protein [Gallionella sp.]
MKTILKYGLLGVGAIVVIVVAGAAYVAATFNPNDYKPQIIKAVKDSTQRNLHLDGDIKLSFFPNIGASLNKVSLSEFRSDKEFAAIESARVSLALLPLLHKQVVVDEVTVSGLKATIVKHKDGTSNINDLLGQSEPKVEQDKQEQARSEQPKTERQIQAQPKMATSPAVKFDIASISVEKTNLGYRDEGSGAQYAIKDLNLRTGRIAIGVPGKIELSANLQANQPKLDITAQLKTVLMFDPIKQRYQLQGLDLQAGGSALDISSLKVTASGDLDADMTRKKFAAKKFALTASGVKVKDNFEVALDAPSLDLSMDKYSSDKLTLNAKLDGASGNITANLVVPGMEGNAQSFKVSALSLDMDVKQPEQAFKVKLHSALTGNVKVQQFNLDNLSVAVNASGEKLPSKSVNSEMKGSVHLDALKQTVQANLAGTLLQSQVKAKFGVKGFANPAIKFDVDLDQLDADLYLPKSSATPAASKSPTKATSTEQPLDLTALRTLNLDGSLRIGALKVMNVRSTQLRADVKALNGLMNINPLAAKLYQGSMNGSLSINAQATPRIAIINNLNGVNVAALTKDAANFDMLEGKGNIGVNLTTQGNTVTAMKKALNGNFSMNLSDGALKGIDIDKKVLAAQALLSKGISAASDFQAADPNEKTAFKEFKATFKVTNGVAHNEDLSLMSQQVRISGAGDINIGNDSIAYLAKAAIAKTSDGKGGITVPVHVSGSFTDLKYRLDYGAMVKEAVKQKVDAKKEELQNRLQDQLKNKLKGLFK